MIDWTKLDKQDFTLISKIANRALLILGDGDKLAITMDISAVHVSGCKLDLPKLLWDFDDLNFIQDIIGIAANLDRSTGQLLNCFSPPVCDREWKGGIT